MPIKQLEFDKIYQFDDRLVRLSRESTAAAGHLEAGWFTVDDRPFRQEATPARMFLDKAEVWADATVSFGDTVRSRQSPEMGVLVVTDITPTVARGVWYKDNYQGSLGEVMLDDVIVTQEVPGVEPYNDR